MRAPQLDLRLATDVPEDRAALLGAALAQVRGDERADRATVASAAVGC